MSNTDQKVGHESGCLCGVFTPEQVRKLRRLADNDLTEELVQRFSESGGEIDTKYTAITE